MLTTVAAAMVLYQPALSSAVCGASTPLLVCELLASVANTTGRFCRLIARMPAVIACGLAAAQRVGRRVVARGQVRADEVELLARGQVLEPGVRRDVLVAAGRAA